ncbi:MAG: EthD family reductase [bacterium]
MVKLIAYYKEPQDKDSFDKKYFEEHMPLAKKMPGLVKIEVSRLKGLGKMQPDFYMQADMYFNNEDELNAAMISEEGRASAKNLMSFAKEVTSMSVAEVIE